MLQILLVDFPKVKENQDIDRLARSAHTLVL